VVEHRTWEQDAVQMPESVDADEQVDAPEGPCLVCGEWVSADEAGYRVRVAAGANAVDVAAHAACLARVAHPAVVLPDPGSGDRGDR
jgi:hypothetical protein